MNVKGWRPLVYTSAQNVTMVVPESAIHHIKSVHVHFVGNTPV